MQSESQQALNRGGRKPISFLGIPPHICHLRDFNFHAPLGAESAPWEPSCPCGEGMGMLPHGLPLRGPHDAAVLDQSPWRRSLQQRRPEVQLMGLREDANETEDFSPVGNGPIDTHTPPFCFRDFPCISRIKGLCCLKSSCLVPR